MAPSLRRIHLTEARHVLLAHRELPEAEQPVWVLAVPGNTAFAAFCDDHSGAPNGANLGAVERFVLRLENHPDGALLGAPGSKERKEYIETLAFGTITELGRAITANAVLAETERKNSDSPSASSPTTGGTGAAADSANPPTP